MNMKDTVILLIFLLSVAGLLIGIHYSEDANENDSADDNSDTVDQDSDSSITITPEENKDNFLKEYLTKKGFRLELI